ncbi:MAG: PEP-CTERM sorting domain-containing protein [Leptolyngbya sp.]|nr:MAG: PEP-CTERM sorting domain-containing protein [Leptolyngbya sp.]
MINSFKASVAFSVFALLGITSTSANAALLVGNSASDSIIRFDEITGTFLGDFTSPGINGLEDPDDLTFGPDGNLYVSVGGNSGGNILDPLYPTNSAVLRFNPYGQYLGVAAAGNGLTRPYGNAFGPDGNLYVSSFRSNQILKFDGTTGSFLSVFASDNNGGLGSFNGLNGPNGLLFAPDGSLYVTTQGTANLTNGSLGFPYASQVLRYSPEQVLGLSPTTTPTIFIDKPALLPESPGFISLLGLEIAPDAQSLYVSDFAGGIRQYDFAGTLLSILSTNYTGTIPSKNYVGSLTFGTDSSDLYAIGFDTRNQNIGSILAFDQAQGSASSFLGNLFTDGSLLRPIGITSVPAAAVPEPATILGAVLGLGGLRTFKRRLKSRLKHSDGV